MSTPKIEESVLLSLFLALTGTAQNVPRDSRASSSQAPPETANAPVQHPLSPSNDATRFFSSVLFFINYVPCLCSYLLLFLSETEILMKILATLVEMKSEIATKQDLMLKAMADGTRKRTRDDEQDQGSPDSRRQRQRLD